jgi:pimeloyl-ACP methyl ester carboxylesterase
MNRRSFIEMSAAFAAAGMMIGTARAAGLAQADPRADSFDHQFAQVNGIRMHYVEAGKGPLVILLHGFPLLWYSWRRQIPALAAAGYRVVVPDQRGYGQTEAPESVRSYNITELVGDIVGLMATLGEKTAVVVGWDWGGEVAAHCALLRPDLFRAVGFVSRPFAPRQGIRPSVAWKKVFGEKVFYQQYFQAPGVADREMGRDIRTFMRGALYGLSADALPGDEWVFVYPPNTTMIETLKQPKALPTWLSQADLDYYAGEYARNGFTGPLNWYRNIDFDWESTSFLSGARIRQPALYLGGTEDPAIKWGKAAYDQLEANFPNLRTKRLIPHAAHLAPEEQPAAVNIALIEFLNGL